MKRILIDGTTISHRTDGLSQYIKNVVLRLDSQHFDFTILLRPSECDFDFAKQIEQLDIRIEWVNIAPIGPKRDWQFRRYLQKNSQRFDAAFIPSNQFPIFLNLPSVYVVHDLIYEAFPEQLGRFSTLKKWFLHRNVSVGLRKATQVVAVSNWTKSDLQKWHKNQSSERIQVIYEGWEHLKIDEKPVGLPTFFEHYFIYVGSSRGHKNLDRLIDAIAIAQPQLPDSYGFVCVGSMNFLTKKQRNKVAKINANRHILRFTGWVDDNALRYYMKHADALIFPSLSEGFGIPVLEAFYYQLPLLASNCTSLPEVAGEAAIYFNPFDVQDIAKKIVSLTAEKSTAETLIKRGNERLKMFSWHKTADEIGTILHKICNDQQA